MLPKPGQSSYRDRTQEFLSVEERLRKSSNVSPSNNSSAITKADDRKFAVAIQSKFNKRASKIGYGIHQTSQKLAKLAKLAKRTSVFDDPTLEIQELTALVKQDISALNSASVDLQFLCNSQNESGNISSDTTTHSTTVVDNLKNRLMGTMKEFKEVPTMRIRCTIRSMRTEGNCFLLLLQKSLQILLFASVLWLLGLLLRHQQHLLLLRGLMVLYRHPNYFPANQQMGNLSHYCSSSIINNSSSWRLHYKTATCRVELKPFIMWNQLSMNCVTFLHNWQALYHGKERLQSALMRTWTIHYQMWKERRTNWPGTLTVYHPTVGS